MLVIRQLSIYTNVRPSLPCVQLKKEDYDLPTLTPKLLAFGKEVSLGRGFQLVK